MGLPNTGDAWLGGPNYDLWWGAEGHSQVMAILWVTTSVIILEPWKGPSYTRWNTQFALDPRKEPEARVIHLVVVEDTIFESWEEEGYQPEVLEDEYFPNECGDHFDNQQPIPQGRKPY